MVTETNLRVVRTGLTGSRGLEPDKLSRPGKAGVNTAIKRKAATRRREPQASYFFLEFARFDVAVGMSEGGAWTLTSRLLALLN
jgi:hypothetical protein